MTARPALRRRFRAEQVVPVLLFAVVIGGIALAFANLFANLRARNIASGFGYLWQTAGFEIGEAWIPYSPQMSFGRALLVGLINTLVAGAAIGVLITGLALVAGLLLAFGGQAGRSALSRYVSITRNVPGLLHLIVWYALFRETLPVPRNALTLGPIVLSNRGLILPVPAGPGGWIELAIAAAAAVALLIVVRAILGRPSRFWIAACCLTGLLTWIALLPKDAPVLRGFNYSGGWVISPEFCALVVALSLYTGGFVSEIVRGAIDTFPRGQVEGAFAVGLSRTQFFLLVMTPQVVRTVAPAMVNQYVNVTKATSFGIVIGYPELVSVSNTSLNQTGQAVEAIALILICYLSISLLVSFAAQRAFASPAERRP